MSISWLMSFRTEKVRVRFEKMRKKLHAAQVLIVGGRQPPFVDLVNRRAGAGGQDRAVGRQHKLAAVAHRVLHQIDRSDAQTTGEAL